MTSEFQSVIEFFGWHTLESTAFALIALAFVSLFRLRKANDRFFILQLAMLKFLLPLGAILTFVYDAGQINVRLLHEYQAIGISNLTSQFFESSPHHWSIPVIVTWASGIVVIGGLNVIGLYRNRKLLTKPQLRSGTTYARIIKALTESGCAKPHSLPIIETSNLTSIGLAGFFRPRIIVNAAFLNTLSDNELLAAVRHELAHASRFDNLARLVHELTVSLFWFHPLVWTLRYKLKIESEIACDESALSQGENPESYAKCLLKAASLNGRYENRWVTSFTASALKKRIRKIVTFDHAKESKMKLIAIYTLLLCGLGFTAAATPRVDTQDMQGEHIYSIPDLDEKPRAETMHVPEYPQALKEQKVSGQAVVEFILDKEGIPRTLRIKNSTHREFEEPAINCVKDSTWTPGRIDGQAVNVIVRIPIVFTP